MAFQPKFIFLTKFLGSTGAKFEKNISEMWELCYGVIPNAHRGYPLAA